MDRTSEKDLREENCVTLYTQTFLELQTRSCFKAQCAPQKKRREGGGGGGGGEGGAAVVNLKETTWGAIGEEQREFMSQCSTLNNCRTWLNDYTVA